MKTRHIGIGCIGSGVGQAVVDSCRLSGLPLRITGFGSNPFAYGLHDCDRHELTPSIHSPGYADLLLERCRELGIDLFIPGLDDEALLLAREQQRFADEGIGVIVSGLPLLELCRDKERFSREMRGVSTAFVRTWNRADFLLALERQEIAFPVIAKPRSGSASRGVRIVRNHDDLRTVSERDVFQELVIPDENDPNRDAYLKGLTEGINTQVSEISIQLVAGRSGEPLGRMVSLNRLKDGVPVEIQPYEGGALWRGIEQLYPTLRELGWRGPLNLQGRNASTGPMFFEMNARFTGISALRALLGFNEVDACIRDWLGLESAGSALRLNVRRFGVRQTADRVAAAGPIREARASFGRVPERAARIVFVTGASGHLGGNFVSRLASDARYELWFCARDPDRASNHLPQRGGRWFGTRDLLDGTLPLGHVDVIVHCAFARPHRSNDEIGASLEFTSELFARAALHQVPAIINLSTQLVYGQGRPPPWTEDQPAAPAGVYADAKFASELLLRSLCRLNPALHGTSLRLTTLAGRRRDGVNADFLSKFAGQALRGEPIVITGGSQQMERLDTRDAVSALCRLLETPSAAWRPVYNVGPGRQYNIVDIARRAAALAARRNGGRTSEVRIIEEDIRMAYGLDITRFCNDTGWQPVHDLDDMLASLMDGTPADG
jgi:nucleoside-diphosphate-sugar epimerase